MAKLPVVSLSDAFESLPDNEDVETTTTSSSNEPAAQEASAPSKLPEVICSDPQECEFNFIGMPENAQVKVRALHRRIVGKLTEAILDAGDDLLRIKALIEKHCPDGTWSDYLANGSPIRESSARNYMRAAEARSRFGASATVAGKLPPTALYAIRKAPDRVVEEVARRVEAGQRVTKKDISDLISADAPTQSAAVPDTASFAKTGARGKIAATHSGVQGEEKDDQDRTSATIEVEVLQLSSAAARELIAQLRDHYIDEEIIKLDKLWQAAGPGAIQQHLMPTRA